MNVLVVAPLAPQNQPTNAVPLVTQALLAALQPRHRVTLATVEDLSPEVARSLDEWRGKGVDVRVANRSLPAGMDRWKRRWRLASTWLEGKYPWRSLWYWEPGLQELLDRLLQEQEFDVVTAEDNAAGIYSYDSRLPAVLTEMEVRTDFAPRDNGKGAAGLPGSVFERLDVARWKDYQALVWERFDCIQVLTPRDAAALRGLQPCTAERVRVNPFSVTLPETADQEDEEEGHVVFAGGFSHPPNVDAARWLSLDILPRLRARGIRSKLTLVGSEPPKEVRSLANGDVFVTGRVPEVEPYLRRAAVVAAPMRSGGGQRMKVLQGMAHGKPVVTTPLGAEGLEIDGASPPLMIGRDSDELADALANLLTSARRRRELGLAARSFVLEHFSPQAYAGRLEAVYQDAIRLHASRNGKSVAG